MACAVPAAAASACTGCSWHARLSSASGSSMEPRKLCAVPPAAASRPGHAAAPAAAASAAAVHGRPHATDAPHPSHAAPAARVTRPARRKCTGHTNIVQLIEVFLTQRYLAIVLEYAPGGDLLDYVTAKDHLSGAPRLVCLLCPLCPLPRVGCCRRTAGAAAAHWLLLPDARCIPPRPGHPCLAFLQRTRRAGSSSSWRWGWPTSTSWCAGSAGGAACFF